MKYNNFEYEYIDNEDALSVFCAKLQSQSYAAVDTEFLREKTYWPELCLVQIKSGDLLACIDALAIENLESLSDILHNTNITKVLHSASQDMEIFYWLDKKSPMPIFDTQIAAPLLGHAEQIGYGNLVKEELGVTLAKTHTRADWTRRPLPEQQIHYALDDVIYLEELYLQMSSKLEKQSRLHWLDTEFEAISDPSKYNKPAKQMWKKMRAAQNLKGTGLAALQGLAEWRELQAREGNLPRSWVIKDDVVADLARQLPGSATDLSHVRGLGTKTLKKHGDKILAIIENAHNIEPEPLPTIERKKKLDTKDQAILEMLNAVVAVEAIRHGINASQLASRKLLEACITSQSTAPIAGWRASLIGAPIEGVLNGTLFLGMRDGEVVIEPIK